MQGDGLNTHRPGRIADRKRPGDVYISSVRTEREAS